MNFKEFITSKIFLRHFVYSVALTLAVVLFILMMLRGYTRHGQALPVPNVYGLTEDEYSEVLDKANLKYLVVDSTYDENVAPGGVVDQIPEAGHKVKKNRVIQLTLNALGPEEVVMPRITDISHRQAIVQLESVGLVPGEVTYEPSEYENLVLKATLDGREIFEGETVTKGTVINLVLGSGENGGSTSLPDLRGMTVEEARGALASASLKMGTLFYDATIVTGADSLMALIFRQHPSPEFSFQTQIGSTVDIWLTTDTEKVKENKTDKEEELDF